MDEFTEKLQILVPEHSSREQLQFQQHLETIAYAQHKASFFCEFLDFLHEWREFGYCSRAQVISIGKSPRKDDTVGFVQVVVFVPEIKNVLLENIFENVISVMVTIGTGEYNDTESQLIQLSPRKISR